MSMPISDAIASIVGAIMLWDFIRKTR
jgi:hypothetical protein